MCRGDINQRPKVALESRCGYVSLPDFPIRHGFRFLEMLSHRVALELAATGPPAEARRPLVGLPARSNLGNCFAPALCPTKKRHEKRLAEAPDLFVFQSSRGAVEETGQCATRGTPIGSTVIRSYNLTGASCSHKAFAEPTTPASHTKPCITRAVKVSRKWGVNMGALRFCSASRQWPLI